jgi:hypothetical protein
MKSVVSPGAVGGAGVIVTPRATSALSIWLSGLVFSEIPLDCCSVETKVMVLPFIDSETGEAKNLSLVPSPRHPAGSQHPAHGLAQEPLPGARPCESPTFDWRCWHAEALQFPPTTPSPKARQRCPHSPRRAVPSLVRTTFFLLSRLNESIKTSVALGSTHGVRGPPAAARWRLCGLEGSVPRRRSFCPLRRRRCQTWRSAPGRAARW